MAVYRPKSLIVDVDGISSNLGRGIAIPWETVESAAIIDDLDSSGYDTKVKIGGTSVGSYHTGNFTLANGERARVIIQQKEKVVLVRTGESRNGESRTGGSLFLFGPNDIDGFAAAVENNYRELEAGQ